MELRDYLRILHKSWILVTASLLIGIAAAAGASILMTPKCEAITELFILVRGDTTTASLAEQISASALLSTSVIKMTVTDQDPVMA